MKKTFKLTHEIIKYPRMIEGVKSEVRKYLKRNRRKELPKGADYWDFDCKFGATEETAEVIHLSEMDKHINEAETKELQSFYVEILGKPGHRLKKSN